MSNSQADAQRQRDETAQPVILMDTPASNHPRCRDSQGTNRSSGGPIRPMDLPTEVGLTPDRFTSRDLSPSPMTENTHTPVRGARRSSRDAHIGPGVQYGRDPLFAGQQHRLDARQVDAAGAAAPARAVMQAPTINQTPQDRNRQGLRVELWAGEFWAFLYCVLTFIWGLYLWWTSAALLTPWGVPLLLPPYLVVAAVKAVHGLAKKESAEGRHPLRRLGNAVFNPFPLVAKTCSAVTTVKLASWFTDNFAPQPGASPQRRSSDVRKGKAKDMVKKLETEARSATPLKKNR